MGRRVQRPAGIRERSRRVDATASHWLPTQPPHQPQSEWRPSVTLSPVNLAHATHSFFFSLLFRQRFTITSVAAGNAHSAAISSRGEMFTWGCGADGKLGHGSAVSEWEPKRVEALASVHVAQVALGDRHTIALDVHGDVFTWGRASFGRLGNGNPEADAFEAIPVIGLPKVRPIGGGCVCFPFVHTHTDTTHVWRFIPSFQRSITHVSAGHSHSAAVDRAGSVYSWGDGAKGKLGTNAHVDV